MGKEVAIVKILVALDESDCSKAAIEYIGDRPWAKNDEFFILSVVRLLPEDVGLGHYPPAISSYEENEKRLCQRVVAEASGYLKERLKDNKVETEVVIGSVVDRIRNFAESWDADLLILGSHGRKGLALFFLGSVAEEIVRSAPCSVEIIKIKNVAKTGSEKGKKDTVAKV